MLSEKKLLLSILLLGVFLRFFNLTWGGQYHFHPDENNIAHSIVNISHSRYLDPRFYAYGQFSSYLAYFSAFTYNSIWHLRPFRTISFSQAIFFLRFWSALSSSIVVYLIYLIGKNFLSFSYPFSLAPPLMVAVTPGLIQAAHFGTTESLLTFFFTAITYYSLKYLKGGQKKNLILTGILGGLSIGTKISGTIFMIIPLTVGAIQPIVSVNNRRNLFSKVKSMGMQIFIVTVTAIVLAILSSPYLILNHRESFRILKYETNIAQGRIPIFYTRQFEHTTPYFFQIKKIFPYALGWPLFILGAFGFLLITASLVKNFLKKGRVKNKLDMGYWVLEIGFLVYFLYNGQLFAKWTRFMTPTLPFFALFAAYGLKKINHRLSQRAIPPSILYTLYSILLLLSILPGIIFFSSVYAQPDIRLIASQWIYQNIPENSIILSEGGNVVNIPIANPPNTTKHFKIINFDFYNLDSNPQLVKQLTANLTKANYILIPSRRIFADQGRLEKQFPTSARYYQLLFSKRLGFQEIKNFSRLNDEDAEETWTVFDHPKIRVFKKIAPDSQKQYQNLLSNTLIY